LVLNPNPTCIASIQDIASLCAATSTLGSNIFPAGDFGSVTGSGETVGTAAEWTATGGFGSVTFRNTSTLAPGFAYNFNTASRPADGEYALVTGVRGLYGGTWIVSNDNSGTSNGYMMVVNSSYNPSVFYSQTISGLCENTRYEFSTDLINLDNRTLRTVSNPSVANAGYGPACDRTVEPNCSQSVFSTTRGCTVGGNCGRYRVEPDIDFLINGAVVATSGPVPVSTDGGATHGGWRKYGVTFRTNPGTTSVTLVMRNRAPGGGGNDVGVDNIAFRACGPAVSLAGNTPQCGLITATVGNDYNSPVFQWQYTNNNGATWIDIGGPTTNSVLTIPVNNPAIGNTTRFRVLLANSLGNLGSTNCRVLSTAALAGCDLTLLPVVLSRWVAEPVGGNVRLGWTTTQQANASHFVVERSADGVNFSVITTVQAAGNSQNMLDYQAFDLSPLPGTSYYRLRQVDYDGTSTTSKLAVVNLGSEAGLVFQVFPNPTKGRFRMVLGGVPNQAKVQFTVFNALGQPVADGVAPALAEELDLSGLPKGVYLVRVGAQGQVRTQRVVLE
jgi:hypothetical protein